MSKSMEQYIQWDVPTWSKAIEFWDRHLPNDLSNLNILEIGARDGGLTLYYAKKGANLTYSDIKLHDSAKELFKVNGLEEKVKMVVLDLTDKNVELPQFDVIICKSVLGGIKGHLGDEAYQTSLQNIYRLLKPNGIFLFAENQKATPLHLILRKKLTAWGGYWHYFKNKELLANLSAFKITAYESYGFLGIAGRLKIIGKIFYLADRVLNNIIPNRFKYISYGLAEKK